MVEQNTFQMVDQDRDKSCETLVPGGPLTPIDLRLLKIALLTEGGISPVDAQAKTRAIVSRYNSINGAARENLADSVATAFEGLLHSSTPRRDLVPVDERREIIVYKKQS